MSEYPEEQSESLQKLEMKLRKATVALRKAEEDLLAFKAKAKNNIFENLESAKSQLREELLEKAEKACETGLSILPDEYEQDFTVEGVEYTATLYVNYGYYDMYDYYVVAQEIDIKEKGKP